MKKITTIAIIAALGLCSCSKDFITKNPLGVSSSATYYNDPDQCQLALNAVYDPLGWFQLHDEFLWKIGDICTDDCERGGANVLATYTTGDDWDKSGQLAVFEATDRSSVMSGIWEASYIGIARANALLDATSSFNDAEYKKMRAEATFLRAWYYFQLTRVFGPVILSKGSVSVADAGNMGNREDGDDAIGTKRVKAQFDFIISDLEAVKDDLPKTADAFGKVTNGAARAFLAKAYLYRADICGVSADYQKAYETAKSLIDDAIYDLEPHFQDVFDIYGESHEQSKEVIFSVQHLAGSKYGREQDGSILPLYVAPRYYYDEVTSTSMIEDGLGYGFAIPTQDLLDEFEDGDARATMIVAAPTKGTAVANTITRLNLDTKAWAKPTNVSGGEGWHQIGATDWTTGYYNMKKSQLSTLLCNSGNNSQVSGKDNLLIRFADVLLIGAEAAVQCGQSADAKTYINRLRARARNSARTVDYTASGTSAACYTYTPATTPADIASVDIDAVKHERRVEMYGEAERYWDLVRWGDYSKFRTQDLSGYTFEFNPTTLGRWPIPQSQIVLNANGSLKQNPGY